MIAPDSRAARLVGCAVMGPKHEETDTPCQDAWHYHHLSNGRVVVAVADGVGSASLSHVGAELAVETVADELEAVFSESGFVDKIDPTRAEWVFYQAFQRARSAVVDEAADRGVELPELDTTLHAVVAGPDGIAGGGVGDGGAVYSDESGYETVYPREKDIAEVDAPHKTHPITLTEWEPFYRFDYSESGDRVAVFSDGLEAWTWDGDAVNTGFFASAFDIVSSADELEDAERRLRAALNNDNFRNSRDDKTFVLATWEPRPTATDSVVEEPAAPAGSDTPTPSDGAVPATTSAPSTGQDRPATASSESSDSLPRPLRSGALKPRDVSEAPGTNAPDPKDTIDEGREDGSESAPIVDVGIRRHEVGLVLRLPEQHRVKVRLTRPHIEGCNWKLTRLLDAYDLGPDSIEELIGKKIPCEVSVRAGRLRVRLDWSTLDEQTDDPIVQSVDFSGKEL